MEEGNDEAIPANVVNEAYEGPPRQVGCERYESLSQLEKIEVSLTCTANSHLVSNI